MSKIRKALTAFVAAAAGAVLTSITTTGLPADQAGWLSLLGAAAGFGLAAALAVYGVPNAPKRDEAVELLRAQQGSPRR